jgi:hypothetical chaperone protein
VPVPLLRDVPPAAYGIDFGTSNSAVSIAYPDGVEVVSLAGSEAAPRVLPSFVYLHRDGRREAGAEGVRTFLRSGHERTDCWRCPLAPYGWDTDCRQYRKGGGCNDARLLAGIKHEIAKAGFAGTNSWATDFSVPELVAVVLARLKREADAVSGADVKRVVIGHPVVFAGADPENPSEGAEVAFGRLREGARLAGFEEVELLPEPSAAVIGAEDHSGVELAADFGGGTFDAAVLDGRSATPRVTGLAGVAVGGETLDGVLFETRVGPELELDRLPSWLFRELRTQASVRLLMADPGIPDLLHRFGGRPAEVAARILFEGVAYDFYKAIEAAKIELSEGESARLAFEPLGLDVPLRRAAFESAISPELDQVTAAVGAALAQAGVRAAEVDRVLLTGGSSQIPAFRDRLAALFGESKLERRDAFTAVVHGLGVRARELWGGAVPRL